VCSAQIASKKAEDLAHDIILAVGTPVVAMRRPLVSTSAKISPCVGHAERRAELRLFYSDTLGIAFEVEDFDGGYLQARLPGDVELVFLPGQATPGTTPQLVFGLAKGRIDEMVAALAARGVEIVTPVSEAPGGWSTEFKDPEGHILSLYQDGALPR